MLIKIRKPTLFPISSKDLIQILLIVPIISFITKKKKRFSVTWCVWSLCPFSLLYSRTILQSVFVFCSVDIYENYRPVVLQNDLPFDLSDVSLWLNSGSALLAGVATGVILCCSQCVISWGLWYLDVSLLVMLTSITWLMHCLPGFSTAEVLFFLLKWSYGDILEEMLISC